ncbi:MAG: protein kinase [Planctomycetota bacterium]
MPLDILKIRQFNAAWNSCPPIPSVASFVDCAKLDQPEEREFAAAIVAADIERRYEIVYGSGTKVDPGTELPADGIRVLSVQDYLQLLRCTETDIILEIIGHEAQNRAKWADDRIEVVQYMCMFPQLKRQAVESKLQEFRRQAPEIDGYAWERELGGQRGAMGFVHLYRDQVTGKGIALKMARSGEEGSADFIVKEAEKLLQLSHDNLVEAHQSFPNAINPFYTMEYVEGTKFEFDSMTRHARLAFAQLVEVLEYLHSEGIFHADVKPDNLLIRTDGRLKLLDLGISVFANAPVKTSKEQFDPTVPFKAGSKYWMSPERMSKGRFDASADWYSVGVMLFETLTGGTRPFSGDEQSLLEQKNLPPRPSKSKQGIPADLDEICFRLLHPNPDERPRGKDILHCLDVEQPLVDISRRTWVARNELMDQLHQEFASTKISSGTTVVSIQGPSGIGKTSIAEQFLASAKEKTDALFVIRGKFLSEIAGTHSGIVSLVHDLNKKMRERWADDPKSLRAFLPDEVNAMVSLDIFRCLKELLPLAGKQEGAYGSGARHNPENENEKRERAYFAFRALLNRLADDNKLHLVVFLDDLQWASNDSAELLSLLFCGPASPRCLLVYTFRDEESPGKCIQNLQNSERHCELKLAALTPSEAEQLLHEKLHSLEGLSKAGLQHACELAEGNPFWLEVIARAISEDPAVFDEPTDRQTIIRKNMSLLSEKPRKVIELLTVAGCPLNETVLTDAVDLGSEAHGAYRKLGKLGLLRVTSDGKLSTYHDQVTASCDAILKADHVRYQSLSAELGEKLQQRIEYQQDYDLLAKLFEQASDNQQAAEFFRKAAVRARSAGEYETAIENHIKSMDLLCLEAGELATAREQHAQLLACDGQAEAAASEFMAVANMPGNDERLRFQCLCESAKRYLNSGCIRKGRLALESVFAEAKLRQSDNSVGSVAVQFVIHGFSSLISNVLPNRSGKSFSSPAPPLQNSGDDSAMEALWAGASGLSVIEPLKAASLGLRYHRRALRSGDAKHELRALVTHMAFKCARGTSRRAVRKLLVQARRIAEANRHESWQSYARGATWLAIGLQAHLQGRWRQAIKACDHAAELLATAEDAAWETVMARSFWMWANEFAGNVAILKEKQPRLYELAQQRNNYFAQLNFGTRIKTFIELANDNGQSAAESLKNLDLPDESEEFFIQHHNCKLAATSIELYAGNAMGAWETIHDQWYNYQRGQLHRVQHVRIDFWKSYAKAALAATVHSGGSAQYTAATQVAVRNLRREKSTWAVGLASLFDGALALTTNDYDTAKGSLENAERILGSIPMQMYAIVARKYLLRIRGASAAEHALDEMIALGVSNPHCMARTILPLEI